MMPGGHLATGLALGGVAYAASGSVELAAGCLAGAFLIDVDHYVDYLTVEGQWRRPGPRDFLRYSFGQQVRRFVLPLHSLELVTLLALVATAWPRPALVGYVAGALLHLVFDIRVNGEASLRSPLGFYWLAYRARHGFVAARLLAPVVLPPDAGEAPVREFFTWRPRERRVDAPASVVNPPPPDVSRGRGKRSAMKPSIDIGDEPRGLSVQPGPRLTPASRRSRMASCDTWPRRPSFSP
jgi:hypothetical protein